MTKSDLSIVFAKMLSGDLSDKEIASYLTSWRNKGESLELLIEGAKQLRRASIKPKIPDSLRPIGDNCGTGGSGKSKFNISTVAAIVATSLGIRIAKHGNRAISGKTGSADLLFAAGFPQTLTEEKTVTLLRETGLTFFFAPNFHPAMKHVMPVRKELGFRTVFNLLGPLANPIAPDYQLLGVSDQKFIEPMAHALLALGCKRALIVHSRDGLDEISPSALTDCMLIDKQMPIPMVIDPAEFKIKMTLEDIAGGSAEENLEALKEMLEGRDRRLADAVSLNAGALLWMAGKSANIAEGLEKCRTAIAKGQVKKHFEKWLEKAGK